MKKILNYMKKNILFSILIIIFILILILGIITIKVLIFPSYNSSKYGSRLEGIGNVNISDNRIDEIKSQIETKEGINYKSYRLSGRIINIYFDIDDSINSGEFKKFANEFVNKFSESELSYYDFQIFVKRNNECVLIGYRNRKSSELSWNYVGE